MSDDDRDSSEEEEQQQIVAASHRGHRETELEDLIALPDEQMYKCSRCNSLNTGYEQKEASLLTYILALMALLVFKLFAVMILPLLIETTKTVIRKCNKCDNVVAKQELLSLPSLTDKVLSFKCGGCAVVISRKYAIILILFIALLYFLIPAPAATIKAGGLKLDNLKWETFVSDCGKNIIMSNGVRAKRNFDQKYSGNIVTWKGAFATKTEESKLRHTDPGLYAIVFVKMIPTETKLDFPDIMLRAPQTLSNEEKAIIDIVDTGTVLSFTASFRTLGNEFDYHTMEVINIGVSSPAEKVKLDEIKNVEYTTPTSSSLRATKTTEPQH